MGNAEQSKKGNSQNQYEEIAQPLKDIEGEPLLVRSKKTQVELQEYIIKNNDLDIIDDINLCKLRSSSYSKNVGIVFNHQLINLTDKIIKVRIQKMVGRLNIIHDLTCLQALCILEGALNGFSQLVFHAKRCFSITNKMIALNEWPFVRVWLHQNFALNKVAGTDASIQTEKDMIENLIYVISSHVAQEDKEKFLSHRINLVKCQKLIGAKNHISCVLHQVNRKNVLKDLIAKQTKKVSTKDKQRKESSQNSHLNLGVSPHIHIKNKMVDPSTPFNNSQKKIQMVTQMKPIFQYSSPKHEKQQNSHEHIINFSPLKSQQKENLVANSTRRSRSKSKEIPKNDTRLQNTLKSLEKKIQRINSEPNDLERARIGTKVMITPTNLKHNQFKVPRISLKDERSRTPKMKQEEPKIHTKTISKHEESHSQLYYFPKRTQQADIKFTHRPRASEGGNQGYQPFWQNLRRIDNKTSHQRTTTFYLKTQH